MTNSIQNITAGQFVKGADFAKAFPLVTARSYAAQYDEDQEAAHAKTLERGHDTAFAINAGSMIHNGSDEVKAAEAAERQKNFDEAVVLATGDQVRIEGEVFTVKIMGERFSDPIHFKR